MRQNPIWEFCGINPALLQLRLGILFINSPKTVPRANDDRPTARFKPSDHDLLRCLAFGSGTGVFHGLIESPQKLIRRGGLVQD